MKTRKETLAIALLVAAATVTLYFATRSEPAAPAASTPPREPPQRAAPAATPEVPAALSAAASATAPVEVERSVDISAARAAVASPAGKGAREQAAPEPDAERIAETPKPEDGLASEPVASADPVASAEPPAAEPVTQAQLAPATPKPRLPEPPAHAVGRFEDRVGASFSLARVTCVLDGQTVYSGAGGQSLQLFQRSLSPGTHSVSVIAEYRAHGAGIFSYASGYEFKVSSGRRFSAGSGKPVQVSVIGYEKGGPTVEFAERLALAISTH